MRNDTANLAAPVSMIGAGSFGTAVAAALARSGHRVDLYCRTAAQAEEIMLSGANSRYFPGHALSKLITPNHDLDLALSRKVVFLAIPSRRIDDYVPSLAATADEETIIVNLAKGLHHEHFSFAALFETAVPNAHYVAFKGPTFAKPIFLGELSGLTCGTTSAYARELIAGLFANSNIDVDHSDSPQTVDILGAIKNIYAVALGIAAALGLSENTTYLLVSRIIREIMQVIETLGYDTKTLFTYSGLADTLLTGFCDTSRNRTFGFMLGRGLSLDLEQGSGFLSEGALAIETLVNACDKDPPPILRALQSILTHEVAPLALLEALGEGAVAKARAG